jgi:chromate reductase
MAELHVVAFAGSLRRGSFNRALLRAARELAPEGMTIEPIEIGALPFFNADVEADGDPASVVAFKASVRAADGILIATPEYNDGIPAVLTNAIDWGSRLPGRAPFTGKPVALMGASPSQVGTARAQLHLRQILGHVHARVLPPPELLVAAAHERFNAELRLTHETTRRMLESMLERFARWIGRERAALEAERALATATAEHR